MSEGRLCQDSRREALNSRCGEGWTLVLLSGNRQGGSLCYCRRESSERQAPLCSLCGFPGTCFRWRVGRTFLSPSLPETLLKGRQTWKKAAWQRKLVSRQQKRRHFKEFLKEKKQRLLTDVGGESCHLNARGHFALTDAEQPLEVRQPKAHGLLPTSAPTAGRELILHRTDPKGFRAGDTRHSAGLGWATAGAEVSALPRDLGTCPLLCCRLSCGHFLRGHRQIPLGRNGPRNTPPVGNPRAAGPLPSHPHVEATASASSSSPCPQNLWAVFQPLVLKCEWIAMSG